MSGLLEQLGISNEELVNRLIQKLADEILSDTVCDCIEQRLDNQQNKAINEAVEKIISEKVIPFVESGVESAMVKVPSVGDEFVQLTISELAHNRANAFLNEDVDRIGKPRAKDSWNWGSVGTRLEYLIDKCVQKHVASELPRFIEIEAERISDEFIKQAKQAVSDRVIFAQGKG